MWEQGNLTAARTFLDETLALQRKLGNQHGMASALYNLGYLLWRQGTSAEAGVLLEEGLATYRTLGNKRGVAMSLCVLGNMACDQGQCDLARSLHGESLMLSWELGDKEGIAEALEGIAMRLVASGDSHRATQLCGAVEFIRESLGTPLPADEHAYYEQRIATARAQLDESAFHAAWAEGRQMTLEQAIKYALSQEG